MRVLLRDLLTRFLTRRSGVSLVTELRQQLSESKARETYWRERCEVLIDDALARKGAAGGPVMTARNDHARATQALVAGMAMQEIPVPVEEVTM
jgi:hypothetical protein